MIKQELCAMSFNLWTNVESIPRRQNGIAQTILKRMPDSAGVQEAREQWREALSLLLGDAYAIACDYGRDEGKGEAVPIYYLKEKYDLLDEGIFWLSETPERYSKGWDTSLPRIAGWALFKDKQTGFTYVHCNTHYDHVGEAAQRESSPLVLARMQRFAAYPIVFTGDLNVEPDSEAIARLRRGGLQSLQECAAKTDPGGTFHHYKGLSTTIDYVFANGFMREAKFFEVVREEYDGTYPSDHFAVAARFVMEYAG